MKFEDLYVGQSASSSKTFSEADVLLFAGVSTDCNPLHISATAAEKGMFGQRVCHGMLVASLISAVLGTKLPGEGTVYMGQNLQFRRPVYLGTTITATVTVKELNAEKHIAILDTICTNEEGVAVIKGEATVMLK